MIFEYRYAIITVVYEFFERWDVNMENNNHIHFFRDYIVPSTCKTNGYTLHRCDCGYEHKDNFRPLAGHSYAVVSQTEPSCTENVSRVIRCTVCGEEITENLAPSGHAWGEWNLQKFPTCTEDGVKVRICSRCGLKEEAVAEATGHKLTVMETTKDTVECLCENCGQVISQPTSKGKRKEFFASHKKPIIAASVSIVLAIALLISTFSFFIPSYNYSVALDSIESGNYAKAYSSLKKCKDFKDSEDLLADFTVYYEEEIYTQVRYNGDSPTTTKTYVKTEFCENGNPKSTVATDENGNIISKSKYNDKGLCESYVSYDSEGNKEVDNRYEYDKNGRKVSESSYDKDGILSSKTEYNDKGDTTLEVEYDSNGKITSKIRSVYEYDENGDLKSSFSYNEDDVMTEKNEFDDKRDSSLQVYYYSNGTVEETYENEYKYNLSDKMTSQIMIAYDSYGEITGKYVTKIKYDLFGNIKSGALEFYSPDGYSEIKKETTYELQNKYIHKYSTYSDGTIKSCFTTSYDEDNSVKYTSEQRNNEYGDLTLYVEYDSEDNITYQDKYEYTNPHIVYTPKSK